MGEDYKELVNFENKEIGYFKNKNFKIQQNSVNGCFDIKIKNNIRYFINNNLLLRNLLNVYLNTNVTFLNNKNNLMIKKNYLKTSTYSLLFDFFVNKKIKIFFNVKKFLNIKKINTFKLIRYRILNILLKKNIYIFDNVGDYSIILNKENLK
jgi:hypothetical protein